MMSSCAPQKGNSSRHLLSRLAIWETCSKAISATEAKNEMSTHYIYLSFLMCGKRICRAHKFNSKNLAKSKAIIPTPTTSANPISKN